MPLARLSPCFQSLPLLPTSKLGPSGTDSGWVGLCTFYDPLGLSNKLSCETGSLSQCRLNPHRYFQSEVLRLYFPNLEPWVAWSVSLPICSSWFIHTRMWFYLLSQLPPRLHWFSSRCLAASPLYPAACLHPTYWSG